MWPSMKCRVDTVDWNDPRIPMTLIQNPALVALWRLSFVVRYSRSASFHYNREIGREPRRCIFHSPCCILGDQVVSQNMSSRASGRHCHLLL